ncbi:hypothetical protein Golob_012761, partial [Gossypium lobatum]|nr:hypothetical protein [Gossypium lobatum]
MGEENEGIRLTEEEEVGFGERNEQQM